MAAREQSDLFVRQMASLTAEEQGQVLNLVEKYQDRNRIPPALISLSAVCILFWAMWAIQKDNLAD